MQAPVYGFFLISHPFFHYLQAEQRFLTIVSAEARAQLDNEQWKERLAGATAIADAIKSKDSIGELARTPWNLP